MSDWKLLFLKSSIYTLASKKRSRIGLYCIIHSNTDTHFARLIISYMLEFHN